MRKLLTSGLAALTAAATIGATATPAAAEPHGWRGGEHEGWRGGDRDDWGWGLGAGLAGFALGAAIASPHYRYGPSYSYGPYYGYDYGPATCVGTRRIWDPYIGAYVIRRFYYAC